MDVAISIIMIILSVTLTTLVVVNSKGADLGGFLGGGSGEGGVSRTRRGVEAIMHNFTIGIAVAFFVVGFIAFVILGS